MDHSKLVTSDELSLKIINNNWIINIENVFRKEQHVDTAASLHQVGCTCYQLENYQNALQSNKEALEIRKQLFGEQYVATIMSWWQLGRIQYRSREYQNSLQSHKAILKQLLGKQYVARLELDSIRQKDLVREGLGNSFHDSRDVLDKERKSRSLQQIVI